MCNSNLSSAENFDGDAPGYWERFDRFLKQLCHESRLQEMLHAVQIRLGTPGEQPDDDRRARQIAHRLHNLVTAKRLQADLDREKTRNPNPQ
jgi:hypothetical protein